MDSMSADSGIPFLSHLDAIRQHSFRPCFRDAERISIQFDPLVFSGTWKGNIIPPYQIVFVLMLQVTALKLPHEL